MKSYSETTIFLQRLVSPLKLGKMSIDADSFYCMVSAELYKAGCCVKLYRNPQEEGKSEESYYFDNETLNDIQPEVIRAMESVFEQWKNWHALSIGSSSHIDTTITEEKQ